MSFEKRYYGDGEIFQEKPAWRKALSEKKEEEKSRLGGTEIGLRNRKSGAELSLLDNGDIRLFSGQQGLILNKQGLHVFGENIQFFGKKVEVQTLPNGWHVNEDSSFFEKGSTEKWKMLLEEAGIREEE